MNEIGTVSYIHKSQLYAKQSIERESVHDLYCFANIQRSKQKYPLLLRTSRLDQIADTSHFEFCQCHEKGLAQIRIKEGKLISLAMHHKTYGLKSDLIKENQLKELVLKQSLSFRFTLS